MKGREELVADLTYCPLLEELGGEGDEYVLVMDEAVVLCNRAIACRTFGEWADVTGQHWEELVEEHGEEYARAAATKRLTPETHFSYQRLAGELGLAEHLVDPRLAAHDWIQQNIAPEVLMHPSLAGIERREGPFHCELVGRADAFVAMAAALREAGYVGIRLKESDGGEFGFLTL